MCHRHKSMSIVILVLFTLFFLAWSSWCPAQEARNTIKVGLLVSLTGTFANPGDQIRRGFMLYLNKVGGKLGGFNTEVVTEDEEGTPAVAMTKVRKLVELEKVHAVAGPLNSSVGMAIRDYIVRNRTPMLHSGTVEAIGDGHYIFRTSFSNIPDAILQGSIAAKDGYKKAVSICPDFIAGRGAAQWFKVGFATKGGTIIQEIFTPLGTMDFGPYLTSISKEADVGIVFYPGGSDSVRFIKQYGEYGLKGKLPLYGYPATVDEEVLPEQGKAAEGFKGASFYFSSINTPENKSFVKDYESKYGKPPTWFATSGYIQAQAIDEAAKRIGGKVEDKEAFVKAIKAVRLKTPAGPFRFDEKNEPVQPRYIIEIREVEKGRMAPVIIDTIPEFLPIVPK
jgi:branched-chain amino acid transport system substrate-binding protein